VLSITSTPIVLRRVELHEDVPDVRLHCRLSDVQTLRNLPIGVAVPKQAEHRELAARDGRSRAGPVAEATTLPQELVVGKGLPR
jgi:hypothetical protein